MAKTLAVTVHSIKRVGTSALGNPQYALNTDQGTFKTRENSGCAYAITNDFSEHGQYAIPAVLELSAHNTVTGWTLTSSSSN